MRLVSLATLVPERSWTQSDCWDVLCKSDAVCRLKPRSIDLLKKVLLGNSGIETRQFAIENLTQIFERSAQELNETFEREATRLAAGAARKAIAQSDGNAPDALFVCTCTGFLCPGLSSHVAEALDLAPTVYLMDNTGAGCGAVIPTLRSAAHYLTVHPNHRVAVVAVEVCSAAFYLSDDPGVLISLCLFGDAAAAIILDGQESPGWHFGEFSSYHAPREREKIRFVNRNGRLCNQLHRSVPEVVAGAVEGLYPNHGTPVDRVISHAGGRDVLTAIRTRLPQHDLAEAASVLRMHGNCSSPSVLMALERAMQTSTPNDHAWWLVSFGAGFSAHGCLMTRDGT